MTESVLVAIDNLVNGWLQPIVISREEIVVGISPLQRIIKELQVGIEIVGDDFLDNLSSKRAITRSGVQTGLGNRGGFGPYDLIRGLERERASYKQETYDAMQPLVMGIRYTIQTDIL